MTYDDYSGTFEGYMIFRMTEQEFRSSLPNVKVVDEWADSEYERHLLSEYDKGIRYN